MDLAFEGSQHSLLQNLRSVALDCWARKPPGGNRSVRDLVAHVGMFKFMYANRGFRDGSMDYDDPPATPAPERLATAAAGRGVAARGARVPDGLPPRAGIGR